MLLENKDSMICGGDNSIFDYDILGNKTIQKGVITFTTTKESAAWIENSKW